ncbi:MAG: hypothetical protein I8H79_05695 [Burkholderiales bacterium]|nr:hypothetical protein [Burkholderiales bacterium]MBH1993846.1 hypothetical protein [Burkholderiales bacterium]MBH2069908.1 hypothetical protein [Burkholderiales bacterium]
MRVIGIILLFVGSVLALYALTMDVTVTIGRGSDLIGVANIDRLSQRLNFIILAGVLSVIGALFIGFSSLHPLTEEDEEHSEEAVITQPTLTDGSGAVSVKICPYCKHMGDGNAESCARCDTQFALQ